MSALTIRASANLLGQGQRPIQEDCVLSDSMKGIFVLADGFGGGGPGAAASQKACEEVKHFLFKEAGDQDATLPFVLRSYFSLAGNVLFNALIFANRQVRRLNRDKNVHEQGGASVIAGYLDGDLLALANVGACSAVLVRGGQNRELVLPRTYGRLADPFGSVKIDAPLMALGMSDDLEPEICEHRVHAGDWLILHSDGVGADFLSQIGSIQLKQLIAADSVSEIKELFEAQKFTDNASISLVIF